MGVFGAVDVTLVYQSEPSGRWLHQPGRPDFISHAQIPWGQGGVYTAAAPVEVGDEHWLFFASATESHAWYLDEHWKLLRHAATTCAGGGWRASASRAGRATGCSACRPIRRPRWTCTWAR